MNAIIIKEGHIFHIIQNYCLHHKYYLKGHLIDPV